MAEITNITQIAAILSQANRLGAEKDEPEGARYIQLSETLVKKMVNILCKEGTVVVHRSNTNTEVLSIGDILKGEQE